MINFIVGGVFRGGGYDLRREDVSRGGNYLNFRGELNKAGLSRITEALDATGVGNSTLISRPLAARRSELFSENDDDDDCF